MLVSAVCLSCWRIRRKQMKRCEFVHLIEREIYKYTYTVAVWWRIISGK